MLPKHAAKLFVTFGLVALALPACDTAKSRATPPIAVQPNNVMSLNACTDQLLISLGDENQIASLTHYAKDEITSPISEIAALYPSNHMLPEEIIASSPDLILTGPYDRDATSKVIAALDIEVARFDVASSIADAKHLVTKAGAVLRQIDKAAQLNLEIDAATAPINAAPITALIYYENGYSAGRDTLIDEVMNRAGLINMAPYYGVGKWGHVDLEQIIANPPQIMILPQNIGTDIANPLRHGVFSSPNLRMQIAYLPNNLGYCGGAVIIELAQHLKQIRANYASK
ncbi:MAG: iron complex transport system substrate-binding protein [Hyphomonadaceae bacterium]|nr:MAG: iron complex transport system substrate-binding protein [Hyphomonadaceae bacterium]KAF0186787.1 MAG: iron complex transport system substrate-binding protein [Hyphomonadaceae bacterium]